MSIGIRSGVNWMRLNFSDIVSASLLTSSVLARPGTPINRRVAAGKQADRQLFDHIVLADDDSAQLAAESAVELAQFVDRCAHGHRQIPSPGAKASIETLRPFANRCRCK